MHGLLNDFGLEPLLGAPFISPSVFILEFLQPGHHGCIHAAIPTAPLVKRGRALTGRFFGSGADGMRRTPTCSPMDSIWQ
jgi:hypothetical protein